MADPADTQRLIGDLIREGTVVSVDLDAGTARVELAADLVTGDIPWLCSRAGKTRVWSPPAVGEQVTILCAEGDAGRAVIAGSLSSDANPHPAKDGSTLIEFEDGARIFYNPDGHFLTLSLPETARMVFATNGGLEINAGGGMSLRGSLTIEGTCAVATGASGTFTTPTGQVVTVQHGIVTGIA